MDRSLSYPRRWGLNAFYRRQIFTLDSVVVKFSRLKKIYDQNSSTRLKNIKRHETELKWIKFLQSPFPLGFNDNIYHEGNISKMPDFDVFSVLECKKRKSRSHGKRKNDNIKREICTEKRLNTSLKDLSLALTNHGRHGLFSFLSSLPISVLRNLELEANNLYDRANKLYKAALLTRCYVQHFLSPYIDSEVNHKRHFIKIPFINIHLFQITLIILKLLSFVINITNQLGLRYLTLIKL